MSSKQTEELNKLYLEWVAALKANPEMPLDELRHMFEQWGRTGSAVQPPFKLITHGSGNWCLTAVSSSPWR